METTNSLDMANIAAYFETLRKVNSFEFQINLLPDHLKNVLRNPIPRLDETDSTSFIASELWFGDENKNLAEMVSQKCFHPDSQSRRIIGVVQAYGCGKTKTCLRLSDSFILLPIRFSTIGSVTSATLIDCVVKEQKRLLSALGANPTFEDVQIYSKQCDRLVSLCLFSLIALYDSCLAFGIIKDNSNDRFLLAVSLVMERSDLVNWCKQYFDLHKSKACDDNAFQELQASIIGTTRNQKIVFLLDEVHVLFDKCRGYRLHDNSGNDEHAVENWIRERKDGKAASGHHICTDLFYQFRLVMYQFLLTADAPMGFVMCSTMFRTWKALEEENSPLSRGTIEQFFSLHWLTHDQIKEAVLYMFRIPKNFLDALEVAEDGTELPPHQRLSALGRPLFLVEFLERLCTRFKILVDVTDNSVQYWLRDALKKSTSAMLKRAEDQISELGNTNHAVNMWTTRAIIRLLYTAQRICGATLELPSDTDTLGELISKGVARIEGTAARFRISDELFVEALLKRFTKLSDQNDAVFSILEKNTSTHRALVSQDLSAKGFIVERVLSWLALSGQLRLSVFNQVESSWSVSVSVSGISCESAGTVQELQLGSAADEPTVMTDIMKGLTKNILLPGTSAGPDLWMRANINGEPCVLAVQSKAENKVYTMINFMAALKSLNPSTMYSSASHAAQKKWVTYLPILRDMPYHRVIFSACGFSNEVHYAVREYNLAYGSDTRPSGQPRRFIHLLGLACIRPMISEGLGNILANQFSVIANDTPPVASFIAAHDWRRKSTTKKKSLSLEELKIHCKYRGINIDKRKPFIIAALDNFNCDLCEFLRKFQPEFGSSSS